MPIFRGSRARLRWRLWPGLLLLIPLVVSAACARQAGPTGPFPAFAEFEGQEVRRVSFTGDLRVPADSLRAVVRTRRTRCRFIFLPFCIPFTSIGRDEYRLNLNELAFDVVRVQLYHRDHGYYGARVMPSVESIDDDRVAVQFDIAPGRQVILRDLMVAGVDTLFGEGELETAMPLREGDPFGRTAFLASADTIRNRLLQRGHAYAEVFRNYGLDTIAGAAEAEFEVMPGPIVYVDTIVVEGNERLTEGTLRRQIASREGGVLRAAELNQSQRNLYSLEMVNFASVRLAPDTLQVDPNQQQATVLVQVVERAQYAVEGSAGFGTVDCVRTSGRWINRNFLGGGRRLEVFGSLSRVGVGAPLNIGLGDNVCTPVGAIGPLSVPGFEVEDKLDYRLTSNFRQPSIFGTQNQLSVDLHAERISEARAYVRESFGSRVAAVRELDAGPTVVTTTIDAERGRTVASPAILCVGFDTCTQEDLDVLRQYRWSNSVSLAAVRDAQRADGAVNRGYIVRGAVDWASPLFFSDDSYLRVVTEGAFYHPLRPGWVFATNLRLGRFLRGVLGEPDGYIPPERRFYAGGPNSVRGYSRNALGPTTYVWTDATGDTVSSAIGGTQLIVGSLEVRMPSPWAAEVMRLAAFVDAGQVSAPGADLLEFKGIRVTPGAGIRFLTPVGPFRFDVAYNPYPREAGPLYVLLPDVGLILDRTLYQPSDPSFLGRFRVQFAIGQAF